MKIACTDGGNYKENYKISKHEVDSLPLKMFESVIS